MRTPTAVTAAVLTATAVLVLTACGGGDSGDSSGSDKISGAPAATTAPPVTTPAAAPIGAPPQIDPALKLPADLKLTFGWSTPADHAQAMALVTSADFIQAIDHGVVKQSVQGSSLTQYASGAALDYANRYIQQYIDHGWSLTGTDRYYDPKVKLTAGGTAAQVTVCEDQSKIFGKVIKTGKVLTTPVDDSSYLSYSIVVARLPTPTELWQAQSITVKEKALECKQ